MNTYPGVQPRAVSSSSEHAVYSNPEGAWYSRSSQATVSGMNTVSKPWTFAELSNGRNPRIVVKCLTGGYSQAPSAPSSVIMKYEKTAMTDYN